MLTFDSKKKNTKEKQTWFSKLGFKPNEILFVVSLEVFQMKQKSTK